MSWRRLLKRACCLCSIAIRETPFSRSKNDQFHRGAPLASFSRQLNRCPRRHHPSSRTRSTRATLLASPGSTNALAPNSWLLWTPKDCSRLRPRAAHSFIRSPAAERTGEARHSIRTENLLVVNMSNMAHNVQLIPTDKVEEAREVFHDQEVSPQEGAPFGMKRTPVLSPIGLPCTPPPWGVIAGIDLANGKIVWRKTLGTTEDLSPGPAMKWGTPNFGGPIVTATGLVFIGAAMDNYLRAFDVSTGAELWRGRLPAGGQATPMTYEWQGRQYVVIYAGGNARAGTTLGDRLVAFALP